MPRAPYVQTNHLAAPRRWNGLLWQRQSTPLLSSPASSSPFALQIGPAAAAAGRSASGFLRRLSDVGRLEPFWLGSSAVDGFDEPRMAARGGLRKLSVPD